MIFLLSHFVSRHVLTCGYACPTLPQGEWRGLRAGRGRQPSQVTLLSTFPQADGLLGKRSWFKCRKLFAACLLICLLLTGCGAERESLFEEEHDLPAHWPSSLADAADKIDKRLGRLGSVASESNHATEQTAIDQCENELRDLVEWIPEVAADTDLSEVQWLPIYELSEVMREHLSRGDVSALNIKEDFRRLQALLVEYATLLPSSTATPLEEEPSSVELEWPGPVSSETVEAEASSGEQS